MKIIFTAHASWGCASGVTENECCGPSYWSSGKSETGHFESREDAEKFISEREDGTGFCYIQESILWPEGEYTFEKSEAIRKEKIKEDIAKRVDQSPWQIRK